MHLFGSSPGNVFSKSWSHIFSDRGNLSRSTTLSWVDREGKSWKPLSKVENLLDKTLSIWKMQLACLCIKLSCYPSSIYYRNGINFEFDKAKRKYTEEKTSTVLFAKGLLECVYMNQKQCCPRSFTQSVQTVGVEKGRLRRKMKMRRKFYGNGVPFLVPEVVWLLLSARFSPWLMPCWSFKRDAENASIFLLLQENSFCNVSCLNNLRMYSATKMDTFL